MSARGGAARRSRNVPTSNRDYGHGAAQEMRHAKFRSDAARRRERARSTSPSETNRSSPASGRRSAEPHLSGGGTHTSSSPELPRRSKQRNQHGQRAAPRQQHGAGRHKNEAAAATVAAAESRTDRVQIPALPLEASGAFDGGQRNTEPWVKLLEEVTYFNGALCVERPHWSLGSSFVREGADQARLMATVLTFWVFPTVASSARDTPFMPRPVRRGETKWRVLCQKGCAVSELESDRIVGCTPTLLMHPLDNTLRLHVAAGSSVTVLDSTRAVLPGAWCHVAIVIEHAGAGRTGGAAALYVRGQVDCCVQLPGLARFNSAALRLGHERVDGRSAAPSTSSEHSPEPRERAAATPGVGFVGFLGAARLHKLPKEEAARYIAQQSQEEMPVPRIEDEWSVMNVYLDRRDREQEMSERHDEVRKQAQLRRALDEQVAEAQRSRRSSVEAASSYRSTVEAAAAVVPQASWQEERTREFAERRQQHMKERAKIEESERDISRRRDREEWEREQEERARLQGWQMLQEQEEMHQRDVRHARADSERHVRDSLDSMVARQRKQVLLQRAEEHRDAHEARVADEHARELQQQEIFRERQRHADQRQALDEQVAERERQRWLSNNVQSLSIAERALNRSMLREVNSELGPPKADVSHRSSSRRY